jgi:hypothetical protein
MGLCILYVRAKGAVQEWSADVRRRGGVVIGG